MVQAPTLTDENAELIEEFMRDAEKAPEDGPQAKEIVHTGDKDMPSPMVINEMKSAGHVYIYDTRTGERSRVHRNNLMTDLKKKRPDGSVVFTTRKPNITPVRGKLKCHLHADDPKRKEYDAMGFAVCPKANLTSPLQVELHMRHRHKIEWETIEKDRIQAEREEERAFQRALLARVGGEAPMMPSETPEETEVVRQKVAEVRARRAKQKFTATCPTCGKVCEGKTQAMADVYVTNHQRSHK